MGAREPIVGPGHRIRSICTLLPTALVLFWTLCAPQTTDRSASGQTLTLRAPKPAQQEVARISLSLKDAELSEVLRAFARLARVNLVLDPSVRGRPVTVELHDVRWTDALATILKSQGLAAQLDGKVLRVAPLR